MTLDTLTIGEIAAFAIAITAIATVIGAVVKWVSGGDDKVRSDAERDIKAVEKALEHSANNNKMQFSAVQSKLDSHHTEIVRLTSDQRSTERAIADMRAELREANHTQTKLIDQRFDAVCTMIREDRESHKDALKELAAQHRASFDTLANSIREIRTVAHKP